MCGRMNIVTDLQAWLDALGILAEWDREQLAQPRYNIAPTTQVPVLIERDGALIGRMMRWGYVPGWCKDEKPRLVNCARAETVATSGYFKRAFVKQRCIFLASGYYEWRPSDKQPFNIRNRDGSPLLMAGVWDRWQETAGAAIITTTPNAALEPVHNRMPEHYLRPAPEEQLEAYPVSTRVNSVRNDGPELIEAARAGITGL